jgi:hypothetical protein
MQHERDLVKARDCTEPVELLQYSAFEYKTTPLVLLTYCSKRLVFWKQVPRGRTNAAWDGLLLR